MSNLYNKKEYINFFDCRISIWRGETFIENEIEILASRFDEIKIISHDVNSEDKRKVPKNTLTYRINYKPTFLLKKYYVFWHYLM